MRRRYRIRRGLDAVVRATTFKLRGRTIHPAGLLIVLGMLGFTFWLGSGDVRAAHRSAILDAIRFVESSHLENPPDGDGGRAIGPYQIHEIYWKDAVQFDPELGGTYQDCRRRDYAERVVTAYMMRWVPEAWADADAETIARTHNGGPRGIEKEDTLKYWDRVRARL